LTVPIGGVKQKKGKNKVGRKGQVLGKRGIRRASAQTGKWEGRKNERGRRAKGLGNRAMRK